MSPLIPYFMPMELPQETHVASVHPSNSAAMSHQRASRLASAPHRESFGCSFCGQSWFVRFGRNTLPTTSTDCPRCGAAGEP